MPVYESEDITRDDLQKLRKRNVCKECNARLDVFMDFNKHLAFLACSDWPRTHHEGIMREASEYEKKGIDALNIPTRREIMEKDYGTAKTKALTKYMGVVSLTKPQAREILTAVFPEAPDQEIARAVLLCASYGLNPLMKHVFLVKFNRWNKEHTKIIGVDWATIMGIKAKRLLSSRRGPYSYVDNTPRQMTEEEQVTVFGEVEADKLWVITKGKDPQTGAEAVGYGFWPKNEKPYGAEKGNTKFNMAAIRSESQMLDRLRPGEMPMGIEVMEESMAEVAAQGFVEGEYRVEEPLDESEPEAVAEIGDSAEPEELFPEEKGKPNEIPEPNTLDDLKETMAQCNWSASDVGAFCMQTKHWSIRNYADLTTDQIKELIEHIKQNPK